MPSASLELPGITTSTACSRAGRPSRPKRRYAGSLIKSCITPAPRRSAPIFHASVQSLLPSNDHASTRADSLSVRPEMVYRHLPFSIAGDWQSSPLRVLTQQRLALCILPRLQLCWVGAVRTAIGRFFVAAQRLRTFAVDLNQYMTD